MKIQLKWVKKLPVKELNKFEDRVVYDTAVYTREFTKGTSAYPYLSGKLQRSEIASPIVGSNKKYGLISAVDYAVHVWEMKGVNWTNPSTKPQWYYTQFKNNSYKIVKQAVYKALKEI